MRRRIVILVVQWQIADLYLCELEFGRRQLDDGIRQLAIERIPAQAANYDSDLVVD